MLPDTRRQSGSVSIAAAVWLRLSQPYAMLGIWGETRLSGGAVDLLFGVQSMREELRIGEVAPAYQVSTLAGLAFFTGAYDAFQGEARFSMPSGMSIDSAGDLILADRGNGAIRKITPDGQVTTLAGRVGIRNDGPATSAIAS